MIIQMVTTYPFPFIRLMGRLFVNFVKRKLKTVLEIIMSISVQKQSNGFVHL